MFTYDIQFVIASYIGCLNDLLSFRQICKSHYYKTFTVYFPIKNTYNFLITPYVDLRSTKFVSYYNLEHITTLICNDGIRCSIIEKMYNLMSLNCGSNKYIKDSTIAQLKQLKYLDCGIYGIELTEKTLLSLPNLVSISRDKNITDNTLRQLTNLTYLNCYYNFNITENSIASLVNLRVLKRNVKCKTISNDTLMNLSKLEYCDYKLSPNILQYLPNLTCLSCNNIVQNEPYYDYHISHLTKLKKMHIVSMCTFTDSVISTFTSLQYLEFASDIKTTITDSSVGKLTNLKYLSCGNHSNLTDKSIGNLTNLIYLNCGNANITDESLSKLTALQSLNLHHNSIVTDRSIMLLTKLTDLKIAINNNLTDNALCKLKNLRNLTYKQSSFSYNTIIGINYELVK